MRRLTFKEYEELKLNSQMRHLLVQCMDDDCLIAQIREIISNCSFNKTMEPVTYEDAIFNSYLPELLTRFIEKKQELKGKL